MFLGDMKECKVCGVTVYESNGSCEDYCEEHNEHRLIEKELTRLATKPVSQGERAVDQAWERNR